VKVAEKVPVPEVVIEAGFVVTLDPANVIVTAEFSIKFEPVTVTVVPRGPVVGFRVIEGVAIVKIAEPEFVDASVATTVFAPGVDEGTLKVAEKVPVPEVVIEAGLVVTADPANVTVTAELGKKFEPVKMTDVPTRPVAGDSESVGVFTVHIAVAECVAESVAITVLAPDMEVGTLNVHVNEPVMSVCTKTGVVVTLVPWKVMVIVEEAAKPWPDAETLDPMRPLTGFKVKEALTVNVAVA
jgi:hypothetical protein